MKIGKSKNYALKDYQSREVNLLPSDFHRAGRIKIYILLFIAVCIIAVGAFGYYEYTVFDNTKALKESTQLKRVEIAKSQKQISNQKAIISIDQRITQKEMILDYLFLINRPIDEIMNVFEQSMNGEVYLTSMTADSSSSFVVSATALSHEAISFTINQLKLLTYDDGSKYFNTVTTQGIVRNEDEAGNVLYLFQLNCEFGGGVTDETQ